MAAVCASCVAQGAVYVGGATVVLQGLAYRARRRGRGGGDPPDPVPAAEDDHDRTSDGSTASPTDAHVTVSPSRPPG